MTKTYSYYGKKRESGHPIQRGLLFLHFSFPTRTIKA